MKRRAGESFSCSLALSRQLTNPKVLLNKGQHMAGLAEYFQAYASTKVPLAGDRGTYVQTICPGSLQQVWTHNLLISDPVY